MKTTALIFMAIAIAILIFTVDLQEDRISWVEKDKTELTTENNKLKLQIQKGCHTDIETVRELERVMMEMKV